MIFSRRDIQVCIDIVRENISSAAADDLARKLNIPGKDRIPAMWEAVILSALSKVGKVESEKLQANGKRPDVAYVGENGFEFVADITCVSDDGLDRDNPIDLFQKEFNLAMRRLGMPLGGYSIRVEADKKITTRGVKTLLKLPEYSQIPNFVKDNVEAPIKKQIKDNGIASGLVIDAEGVFIEIEFDSSKCPFAFVSHPSYDVPLILDRNPLYSAIRGKAKEQLKGLDGVKGIIVCDGDCSAMRSKDAFGVESAYRICNEFFRQHQSIDFILLIAVQERRVGGFIERLPNEIYIQYRQADRIDFQGAAEIAKIFEDVFRLVPAPKRTAVNGVSLANNKGYGAGYKGGFRMGGGKVKLSSRVIMDVLSGRRSVEEFNKDFHAVSAFDSSFCMMPNPFEMMLKDGRLPISVTVEKGDEDDWLEFEFGEADAAISPFK